MESELALMREQLLANANLLASPSLSRVGSRFYKYHFSFIFYFNITVLQVNLGMRASTKRTEKPSSQVSLDGIINNSISEFGDFEQSALILKQQNMLNEIRMR